MYLNNGALLKNGEYRIENVLAAGGFGITYLAMQVALGRKVAVKEFFMKEHCNRDSGNSYVSVPSVGSKEQVEHFKEKFLKEARLIASFDHSNIIRIHDVFEENGTAYYVMEYLEGESLSTLVARCGAIDEQVALRYTRQVADALAEVHAGNLLHLDVKPANIMLNKKGEAVLIDFGISKHYDSVGSQTSSGPAGISEGYAPLEQYEAGALSSFTPATDVYSLGATLYFLVTGQRPPKAGDVMNDGLPVLPSRVSPEVRAAIEAAMQPRRKDRPQSVAEFLSLLESTDNRVQRTDNRVQRVNAKALEVESEETRALEKEPEQVAITDNEPAEPKKNRTVWVVAAVVLLGILIAGFFYLYNSHLEKVERERIVLIEQQHQDSIDAREAEETRIEQLCRDSIAAVEAELARIEQQRQDSIAAIVAERERIERSISTSKKVDLGLSVCWAGWNVGASSPEEYGGYYAWGETYPKSNYTTSSYQYHNGSDYIYIGSNISGTQYDVVREEWGSNWRLPTKWECEELTDRCTWTWITYKGIGGCKVTGPNGNSIFLPAAGKYAHNVDPDNESLGSAGAYWSSTKVQEEKGAAYTLMFSIPNERNNSLINPLVAYFFAVEWGQSVRPVCDK